MSLLLTLNRFTHYSDFFIIDFKQVNVSWEEAERFLFSFRKVNILIIGPITLIKQFIWSLLFEPLDRWLLYTVNFVFKIILNWKSFVVTTTTFPILPLRNNQIAQLLNDYCRVLTSAHSQQPDSNQKPLVSVRKSLVRFYLTLRNEDATLLKRDTNIGAFLWNLRNFEEKLFLKNKSGGCFISSKFYSDYSLFPRYIHQKSPNVGSKKNEAAVFKMTFVSTSAGKKIVFI